MEGDEEEKERAREEKKADREKVSKAINKCVPNKQIHKQERETFNRNV